MTKEVNLGQMLLAREKRAEKQQALLNQFGGPLVCFTMNIPGPVKRTPLIRRSFRRGVARLEAELPELRYGETLEAVTGCEGYFLPTGDPVEIKRICTRIEDEHPLGRLFDMDVLDSRGVKLDRSLVEGKSRDCIVCGASGRGCASRRLHSLAELEQAVRSVMTEHFLTEEADRVAGLAVESLLEEVRTTPKPGLVDRRNNGSHRDMDIGTFTASAEALGPYFRDCFRLGRATATDPAAETFSRLRQAGRAAEETMYTVTGGVNTHKGAIFTLGLLCGGLGRIWDPADTVQKLPEILEACAELGKCALQADFQNLQTPATAGEKLYVNHGLTGIRGEAAAGLPCVRDIGLPAFRQALDGGFSRNDAAAVTLLHLMARVEDTNLYHRGGPEGAAWAKTAAEELLPRPTMDQIRTLDDAFICRNLSPGGCADLLAVTLFLDKLDRKEAAG